MSNVDNYFQTGDYETIDQYGTHGATLSILDFQVPSIPYPLNASNPWSTTTLDSDSGGSISALNNVSENYHWNITSLAFDPSVVYDTSTLPLLHNDTAGHSSNYPAYDKAPVADSQELVNDDDDFESPMGSSKALSAPNKTSRKGNGRRKPFQPVRREEVAMTRSVGACLICRTLRVKCDTGVPCRRCIKEFERPTLAFGVCWRQTLLSARFNNVDLLRVSSYEQLLDNIQSPFVSKYVASSFSACCGPVEHLQSSYHMQPELEPSMVLKDFGPTTMGCTFKSRRFFPISVGGFIGEKPDLEVFLQQHPVSGHQGLTGPFSRVHKAFGLFAERSKATTAKLAIKDRLTAQCIELNRELDRYHKSSDSQQADVGHQPTYPDPVNAFQIKYDSGRAAYNLEMEILKALEKRIYKPGNDKKHPLAVWFCLWTLMLSYHEHMHFTKYFNYHDKRIARPLHELAKHMFNGVTTIYATLFRDESPLKNDWNTIEIMEELGHDQALIESFLNIKSEIKLFYTEKEHLTKHDIVFKTLVAEPDCKLLSL